MTIAGRSFRLGVVYAPAPHLRPYEPGRLLPLRLVGHDPAYPWPDGRVVAELVPAVGNPRSAEATDVRQGVGGLGGRAGRGRTGGHRPMNQPRPRHRRGTAYPRPRRPGRHEVYKARSRGQALAVVVLAGAVLAMLVVFVRLLADDRDGAPLALSRPAGVAPRQ